MPININYDPCQGQVKEGNAYLRAKPNHALSDFVQEFWQLNVPLGLHEYRSVPDNCVDLIINLTDANDIFIVSPFSTVQVFEMMGPVAYFGIRFRPLGHQGFIASPVGVWNTIDHVVKANEVVSEELLNALIADVDKQKSFQSRCLSISTILLDTWKNFKLDARLLHYIEYSFQNTSSRIDLSDKQCSTFGLSARQLRRLTASQLGLSPRSFANVFRFQGTLQFMKSEKEVPQCGLRYYDQPHFIRDFKSMSGVTPNQFNRMSVLYNTE